MSEKISVRRAREIFSFRTRMETEIKENFRTMYNNDTDCPLYCGQKDSQQHLLVCDNAIENFSNVNYMDLFSRDVDKIMKVVEAMKKALQNRTEGE